ncbi:MAG: YHS domain-containing (seleno)protein [Rhizobiaceae bacterium]
MNRIIHSLLAALALVLVQMHPVAAASPVPSLNLSKSGLALRGYDPVAYFNAGKPVKGDASITVKNGGAEYRFSSQENKALFVADPKKYLPEFGGFCAYGAAVNYKVDGDPKVWNIVDGKLYLNINRSVDKTWRGDKQTYISKANKNWTKLKNR